MTKLQLFMRALIAVMPLYMHANPITFIGQSDIGTTGYTISSAGLYVLTDGINFASTGTAIIISSDNVILDLNNKHIVGSSLAKAILVSGSHKNIVVKNGVISDFLAGFDGETGGIFVGQLSLQNLNFIHQDTSPSGVGILIRGNNIEIDNCLTCSFNIGIQLDSCNEIMINKVVSNFNSFNSDTAIGLYLNACKDVDIQDSSFNYNVSGSVVGTGISIVSCFNVRVKDSTCNENQGGNSGIGASIEGAENISFIRCEFSQNAGNSNVGVGVVCDTSNSSNLSLYDCQLSSNNSNTKPTGLGFWIASGVQVTNLIIKNCCLNENKGTSLATGVYIAGTVSGGLLTNCESCQNDSGGAASGFFFLSSGASKYITLNNCLAQAHSAVGESYGYRIESGNTGFVIQSCKAFNNIGATSFGFSDSNASLANLYMGNIAFGQGASGGGSGNFAGTGRPVLGNGNLIETGLSGPFSLSSLNTDVRDMFNISFT